METDDTYMYLSILTFLAYAAAIGLAFLLWNSYRDPALHTDVGEDIFTMRGAPVVQVDYRT